MTAILKVRRRIKIRLSQSMHIYLKNNRAKFHPDPILKDGALGFLRASPPQEREQDEEQQQGEYNNMASVPDPNHTDDRDIVLVSICTKFLFCTLCM